MIDPQHLRPFYEVARRGSFTAAALALHVSQSAVSKAVKLLEEQHEVRLFDRARRGGVHLTPTGQVFLDACAKVFEELEGLQHALSYARHECVGQLAIGASDNVCNYVLPRLLPELAARFPSVTFKLFAGTSAAIEAELFARHVEVGLFYTEPKAKGLIAVPLAFVEFAVVVRAERRRPSLAELQGMPFVGSRAADYTRTYPALSMLATLGLKPKVVLESNNQETQKRLVLAGLGYTVVPRFMVEDDVGRGVAHLVRTPQPIGSPLYLVTRQGRTLSKPALVFAEHVQESLPPLVS